MKRFKWFIIPLLLFSLASCEQKNESSTTIEKDSNVQSAAENLEIYSSLLDDINEKGLKASLSEYYKTNFSYSISYLSGRTNYNVINLDRTCKVRNDSLYILKTTTYQYGTNRETNASMVYLKSNDSIYSYEYEGDVTTLDTEEVLPVYEINKEEEFDLKDAFGFSQSVLTSQAYDGTNGSIKKENNVYTIIMSYADVKNESLVKFIINLGYFNTMLSYISEDDLKVNFIYTITDDGYKLDYGFSYDANNEFSEKTIEAKVSLSLEKTSQFDIIDFSDESKYVKKYPQEFNDVVDINTVGETIIGRYQGYSLFKFYLKEGKYGILSDGNVVTNYSIYNSLNMRISKYSIDIDSKISIDTNYFEVKEEGYYYIYLEISTYLKSFSLNSIDYIEDEEAKELADTNQGKLKGVFDYEIYSFSFDTTVELTIENKSNHRLCLIVPVSVGGFFSSYLTSYRTVIIEENNSIKVTIVKGSYYLIVTPLYQDESLEYNFTVSTKSYL